MNQLARYIMIGVGLAIILFLLWYFSSIVWYILISAVLSLVGKPLVDLLSKIKIKSWSPPKSACAGITLIVLWMLFFLFFRVMIPLVINQVNDLSNVNVVGMVASFEEPISQFDNFIGEYLPAGAGEFSLQDFIVDKLSGFFHVGLISSIFSSTAGFLTNLFIAAFSITFITFFFLKDDSLFFEGIVMFFPKKIEMNIKHALISVNKLLRRYFIGIIIQSICIMLLDTLGLSLVGIKFQTALVMGLLAGILNVIPYVGPLIGTILGISIGIATNLNLDFSTQLVPLIIYMAIVFGTVQLMDNFIFQPLIFSNSVSAHPLEIFLVLLIAGSVGGVIGMLLAIPGYTVIRVFAKEFFNKFRVVQKLTEKI